MPEAAELCSKILSADASHAGTLHLRGIIAYREGNRAAAIEWFRRAQQAAPDFAAAFNDMGNVLMEDGRTGEAIAEYQLRERRYGGLSDSAGEVEEDPEQIKIVAN